MKFQSFFAVLCSLSFPLSAQVSLPQASPKSTLYQTIGLSEVVIEYSRPAVKGRKIWDGLIPYQKVWRTGSNAATWISFSHDVMIGEKEIKAGKYAIFTIPDENEWTIILNTNKDQWGSTDYKQEFDVCRFNVKPVKTKENQERLLFLIEPSNESEAQIVMRWEFLEISFGIKFKTTEIVKASIEKTTASMWRTYSNSALFYYENNIDLQKALEFAEISIALNNKHFLNRWIKAMILAKMGKTSEALASAQEAEKIGSENPALADFFAAYKTEIANSIAIWKKK